MLHAISPSPLRMQLGHRDMLALDSQARRVDCDSGSLWITQDRDLQDAVLDPGHSLTLAAGRRAIVYALEPSTLRVHACDPAPRSGHRAEFAG